VIGALLILSVLGPNIARGIRETWNRRTQRMRVTEEEKGG
jgi:hypothetical protein